MGESDESWLLLLCSLTLTDKLVHECPYSKHLISYLCCALTLYKCKIILCFSKTSKCSAQLTAIKHQLCRDQSDITYNLITETEMQA